MLLQWLHWRLSSVQMPFIYFNILYNLYLLASQFILSKKYEGDSHARGDVGVNYLGIQECERASVLKTNSQ